MNRRLLYLVPLAGALALGLWGTQHGPAPSPVGCDVTITSHAQAVTLGAGGTALALAGTSLRCPGGTVHVLHGGVEVGTATVSGSGTWTYADSVPDRATTVVTASITGGGKTKTAAITVTADTRNPEITLTTPTRDGAGHLWVVAGAPHGNVHVQHGDRGYYPDQDSAAAGGQVALDVTVLGANGGSLVVSFAGSVLLTQALSADPAHVTGTVTLPEATADVLTLTASSATGSAVLSVATVVQTTVPTGCELLPGVPHGADGGTDCLDQSGVVLCGPSSSGDTDGLMYCYPSGLGSDCTRYDGGDPLLCKPCTADSQCGRYGRCFAYSNGHFCQTGCGSGPYPDGGPWTHVTNTRHADMQFAFTTSADGTCELGYSTSTRLNGATFDESVYMDPTKTCRCIVGGSGLLQCSGACR